MHVTYLYYSANIGLSRDCDKKWISQYEALFCVLNGLGQVVTWKLTAGVSFDDVEDYLVALHKRFEGKLKEFYIDYCCTGRKKLQHVFGPELRVYGYFPCCTESGRKDTKAA